MKLLPSKGFRMHPRRTVGALSLALVAVLGCASGDPAGGGAAGAAGVGKSGGAGGNSGGAGGSGPSATGGAGQGASGGSTGGAGGGPGTGATGGSAGGGGGGGTSGGPAGTGGGGATAGGAGGQSLPPTTDSGASETPPVSSATKVLVYTHSTGFRHDSIEAIAAALDRALDGAGFAAEVGADPKRFTTAGLADLRGVVLVSTTGKPLGEPGTEAIAALDAFVKGGGALIGYHAASSTFYEPPAGYSPLIGGRFDEHPGGVRSTTCHPVGSHPAAVKLPPSFMTRDEIYVFKQYLPDNQVMLECMDVGGQRRLPIAWSRAHGQGRVFYSALGHSAEDFAPGRPLMANHFLPGALWALGR